MSTAQQEHGKIEQLQHASADEIEVMAGRERENLEGWVPELASEAEVREALEKAFDYRGDITITRRDGTVSKAISTTAATARHWRILSCGYPDAEARRADRAADDSVQRHRGAEVQRARHGGGQDLRSLGEEVLGEEGCGREEHPDRAGEARLEHEASMRLFLTGATGFVGSHVARRGGAGRGAAAADAANFQD